MNTKFNIILVCLFLVTFVFFEIGCNEKNDRNKINVLVSLPLSGDAATYGKLLKDGVEYGLSEINPDLRSKMNVIFQDDKLSTKDAITILQQENIRNRLSAAMTTSTELAMNLGPICSTDSIVLLPPIADGDKITQTGEFVFLMTPTSSYQGKELSEYIVREGLNTTAIVYLNDSWGNSLSSEYELQYKANHGEVIIKEGIQPGQRDFRTLLLKIKKSNPQVILILLHPTEMIPLMKQLREMALTSRIYGGDTFSNKELFTENVSELVQGVNFTLPSQPNNSISQKFKKGFFEKYQYEPDINTAAARDAIILLSVAIEKGAIDGNSIKSIFANPDFVFEGATGTIKWDKNRNVTSKKYKLYTIKGNEYLEIK